MAEQLICNQQVVGSTPITSSNSCDTFYGGIPERPKGADCKSVVTDFAGPNPASPTNKKEYHAVLFFVAWWGEARILTVSFFERIWFDLSEASIADLESAIQLPRCSFSIIWFAHLPVSRSLLARLLLSTS